MLTFEQIFKPEELVSKLVYDSFEDKTKIYDLFDPNLKKAIEHLRSKFDYPFVCNNWHRAGKFQQRGYRGYDCSIGASKSAHRFGKALDFDIIGWSASFSREQIVLKCMKDLPVKIRLEDGVTWVHLDVYPFEGSHKIYLFKP